MGVMNSQKIFTSSARSLSSLNANCVARASHSIVLARLSKAPHFSRSASNYVPGERQQQILRQINKKILNTNLIVKPVQKAY
jgi:hypothetical protein